MSQFSLCCQAPDSSSCFSTGDLVFARLNLKSAVLKNFVFDWALCFRLCEVYHFQNLVGLELPIKHALTQSELGMILFIDGKFSLLSVFVSRCLRSLLVDFVMCSTVAIQLKENSAAMNENNDKRSNTRSSVCFCEN